VAERVIVPAGDPRALAIAAGLVLATLGVYGAVASFEFVDWDDVKYVVEHPDLESGITLDGARRVFFAPHYGDWIPLTYLSLQLDRSLWGPDAGAHHITNAALHVFSTLLLFFALLRMSGALGESAFVAGVFALHPLHVESVAWVFERKDVLSGFFFMLALHIYAVRVGAPSLWGRVLLPLLCMVLGLLAKPMLVTLPIVLLLLDYWPLARAERESWKALVIEKLPLFAVVALVSAFTFLRHEGATADEAGVIPFDLRVLNAFDSYVIYIWKSIWPTDLSPYYAHRLGAISLATSLPSLIVLVALSAFALFTRKSHPYFIVGWVWYGVMLVPVIGLITIGGHGWADRYMYLPQIGLSISLTWGLTGFLTDARSRRVLAAIGVGVLVAFAIAAFRQVSHWRDSVTLFERAVDIAPDDYRMQRRLGAALLKVGRIDAASLAYREALRVQPDWAAARFELASMLEQAGRTEEAIPHYRQGLARDPTHVTARENIVGLLRSAGRHAEARSHLEFLIRTSSNTGQDRTMLRLKLADVQMEEGDFDAAIETYRAVLEASPRNVRARASLGFALLRAERFNEARQQLEGALALEPTIAAIHSALGLVASHEGRFHDALRFHHEALRLHPTDLEAANNLAWFLATCPDGTLRDGGEALKLLEPHAASDPDLAAVVLDTLAAAHAANGEFPRAVEVATRALRAAQDAEQRAGIEARLTLYRSDRPFLEGVDEDSGSG
jgi:tetratricopeptide (TPR) repeat protein